MTNLAVTVLVSNDNAFQELTREQTMMMLLTFKEAKYNKSIQQMQVKYTVYSIYKKLHNAIISLVCANNKHELTKIIESQAQINLCLNQIYQSNTAIQDAFVRLFIAEFKEQVYDSHCDPSFGAPAHDILIAYETIISEHDSFYGIINHQHDPDHFIVSDKRYSFYDMCECNGVSIFDYVQEDYDDIIQDDEDW
jgi:hypothetical protein